MSEPRLVVVSGASGLIGRALVPALVASGYRVVRLARGTGGGRSLGPDLQTGEVAWRPDAGELDLTGLGPIHGVVHLAGENVGDGRWTDARKRAIRESRVAGTRTIVQAMRACSPRPGCLVSASGIGYYGDAGGDVELDEGAPAGTDFLAEVCSVWEAEAAAAEADGIRVARMRTGVVLTPEGGALERLLTPFKLGLGGRVGSGRQWMAWISLPDVVRAYTFALASALSGPVNVSSPNPVTQGELAKALGRVLGRPTFMPLPSFMVKAMFGEMGSLLLGGQRALPRVLTAKGFTFEHPELEPALRDILGRPLR